MLNKLHAAQLPHEDMEVWPVVEALSGLVGLGVGAHLGSGEAAMDRLPDTTRHARFLSLLQHVSAKDLLTSFSSGLLCHIDLGSISFIGMAGEGGYTAARKTSTHHIGCIDAKMRKRFEVEV